MSASRERPWGRLDVPDAACSPWQVVSGRPVPSEEIYRCVADRNLRQRRLAVALEHYAERSRKMRAAASEVAEALRELEACDDVLSGVTKEGFLPSMVLERE